jgi:hypothetical protein
MKTLQIRTQIGQDGILRLELPTGLSDTALDVVVVLHPVKTEQSEWEAFIEATAGSLADDPIEHPQQGSYEQRDELV